MRDTLVSVVDDDESVRDATKTLLRSAGYNVATFASGELFLQSDMRSATRCLVLDKCMLGMDGLELQRQLNVSDAGIPIIFVTAHADNRSRQLAIDGGASDFFQKPFAASTFLTSIGRALQKPLMQQRKKHAVGEEEVRDANRRDEDVNE